MKRKTIFVSISSLSLMLLGSSLACFTSFNALSFQAEKNKVYTVTFDNAKNKLTKETTYQNIESTNIDLDSKANTIRFKAGKVKDGTSGWQEFNTNGYFQNLDHIIGMDSLTLTGKGIDASSKATIYYAGDLIDPTNLGQYQTQTITFPSDNVCKETITFTQKPNYIYVEFSDNPINIDSAQIVINEECKDFYQTLKIENLNPTMGDVQGEGNYYPGSTVELSASANNNYNFDGWYLNNEKVSSDNPYTITMPNQDVTYQAKFSGAKYTLTLLTYDNATQTDNAGGRAYIQGTTSTTGQFEDNEEVTITATPNPDRGFVGWFIRMQGQSMEFSQDNPLTFQMFGTDFPLTAVFDKTREVIVKPFKGQEELGVTSGSGTYALGSEASISATPTKEGYYFTEWVNENGEPLIDYKEREFKYKVTKDGPLTFYAKFTTKPGKGSLVNFGEYPQSNVTDKSLIATLDAKVGALPTIEDSKNWTNYTSYYIDDANKPGDNKNLRWYRDIQDAANNRYRAVYMLETPENNNGYLKEEVYYFSYEPISWTTVDSNGLMLANDVLDANQCFYHLLDERTIEGALNDPVYPTSYEYSDMRTWLNGTFLDNAFINNKEKIKSTTVDNSGESFNSPNSKYASNNTIDRIFLPSVKDVEDNGNFGYTNNASRNANLTDYAKCMGAMFNKTENGCTEWYLRSPAQYNGNANLAIVNSASVISSGYHRSYSLGVRPALTLAI